MKLKVEKRSDGRIAIEMTYDEGKKPVKQSFSPDELRSVIKLFETAMQATGFSMTWESSR